MIVGGAILSLAAVDAGDGAGAAQGGYPGPIAQPGIPTGPDIGAIKVHHSSRTTWVCGFTPERLVTFTVAVSVRGTGQTDANGCVSFVVTALSARKVLIRTYGPTGPVTLGPIRVHKRAGIVTVSGRRNGVVVGLSMAFTIVVKATPPPSGSPPTTIHTPRTTVPRSTTTTLKKRRSRPPRTTVPISRHPSKGPGTSRRPVVAGGQIIAGTYLAPFVPGHLTPKETKSAVVALAAAAGAVAAVGSLGGAAAAGAAGTAGSAGAAGSSGAGSPEAGVAEAEAVEIEADRIDDELPEWEEGGLGGDIAGGPPTEGS